jgi:hypothetical protein
MLEKYKHIRIEILRRLYNVLCYSIADKLKSNNIDECHIDFYKNIDVYYMYIKAISNNTEYTIMGDVKRTSIGVIKEAELLEIQQALNNNLKSNILHQLQLKKDDNG